MTGFSPFRLLGMLAILGGAVRIPASFLSWDASDARLEALALGIDICLLLGLSGLYFGNAARLGLAGFVGYAIAAAGVALITGPDGAAFGVDMYRTGVIIIAAGLAILSVMLLIRKISTAAGAAWLLAIVAAGAGAAIGRAEEGFVAAGLLFGAGFIAAGAAVLRDSPG